MSALGLADYRDRERLQHDLVHFAELSSAPAAGLRDIPPGLEGKGRRGLFDRLGLSIEARTTAHYNSYVP